MQRAIDKKMKVSFILGVTGRSVTLNAFKNGDENNIIVSKSCLCRLVIMLMLKSSYSVTNAVEIFGFMKFSF